AAAGAIEARAATLGRPARRRAALSGTCEELADGGARVDGRALGADAALHEVLRGRLARFARRRHVYGGARLRRHLAEKRRGALREPAVRIAAGLAFFSRARTDRVFALERDGAIASAARLGRAARLSLERGRRANRLDALDA